MESNLEVEVWEQQLMSNCPQFLCCYLTLKLQRITLVFLWAQWGGNFHLYVDSLIKFSLWFFALDQTNYARWLPVHIRDFTTLQQVHPEIQMEFLNGNCHSPNNPHVICHVSDSGHEQNNVVVKGTGGDVGLTENPSAF